MLSLADISRIFTMAQERVASGQMPTGEELASAAHYDVEALTFMAKEAENAATFHHGPSTAAPALRAKLARPLRDARAIAEIKEMS
jgi:hypothetical protein